MIVGTDTDSEETHTDIVETSNLVYDEIEYSMKFNRDLELDLAKNPNNSVLKDKVLVMNYNSDNPPSEVD